MNHLYCGDGKGKTSILNGMLIRAVGCKMKVKYYRFLKNWETGEIGIIKKLNVPISDHYWSGTKFFWEMNDVERKQVKEEVQNGIKKLLADVKSGEYDLILIDELFSCLDDELISEEELINVIKECNLKTELAFSAHEVDEYLYEHFDLISKVKKIKHYYETTGLIARKGIEY